MYMVQVDYIAGCYFTLCHIYKSLGRMTRTIFWRPLVFRPWLIHMVKPAWSPLAQWHSANRLQHKCCKYTGTWYTARNLPNYRYFHCCSTKPRISNSIDNSWLCTYWYFADWWAIPRRILTFWRIPSRYVREDNEIMPLNEVALLPALNHPRSLCILHDISSVDRLEMMSSWGLLLASSLMSNFKLFQIPTDW